MEHPVEERNLALKVSIVLGKTMELTKLQSECDKEFKEIVTELRHYLRENGYDQSIADAAEKEYKEEKGSLAKALRKYSGGSSSYASDVMKRRKIIQRFLATEEIKA